MKELVLLTAFPVTLDEFIERAPHSHYLRGYFSPAWEEKARAAKLEEYWHGDYSSRVGEPLLSLASTAREFGAQVVFGATLDDLRDATQTYRVVVILGHWKGADVLAEDLPRTLTLEHLEAQVRDRDAPVAQWLKARLAGDRTRGLLRKIGERLNGREPLSPAELLQEALDADIRGELVADAGVDFVVESSAVRRARRRDTLDRLFDGLLASGNRLEWRNGFESKEAINAAIAPSFSGVLDLTACHSVFLADYLARGRTPPMNVVQFPRAQDPTWACFWLETALRIHAEGLNYLDARIAALKVLKKELEAEERG